MIDNYQNRLQRARVALEGLSIGDAIGGFFEGSLPKTLSIFVRERRLPGPIWRFTDDTNMALSIFSILRQYGEINQDKLAASFGKHYQIKRGYGRGAMELLYKIQLGKAWQDLAPNMFNGSGSFGNGAAMRVAPLGGFFADDDFAKIIEQARYSAEVTHAHPEGIEGAVVVALATAYAWRWQQAKQRPTRTELIKTVLDHLSPQTTVCQRVHVAYELSQEKNIPFYEIVRILGNGSLISAQDTVPLVLWIAGEHLDNFSKAIWTTLSAGGDTDTTAAMVGGIVASYTGLESIPKDWIKNREKLPFWAFGESL